MKFKKGNIPWNKGIHMWKNKEHPKGMKGKKNRWGKHKEETKRKIGNAVKENAKTNPNSGMKGKISKMLGETYEEIYGNKKAKQMRLNKSLLIMGDKNPNFGGLSKKHIEKISLSQKGKKHSIEHIKKQIESREKNNKKWILEETKRKISDTALKNRVSVGEKNPNWLGGLSFEPYDSNFNNKFKRAIRKRDNQICLKCGIHREKLLRALDVHHINYNKLMSIPQNCCSLCRRCNIEVNKNRKHWTKFFQSLLNERYDYKYNTNQEVILEVKKNE